MLAFASIYFFFFHPLRSSLSDAFYISFLPSELPFKMELDMAIQNTEIFAEIMYNDNKGNSNSNSCYTSR